MTTYLPTPTPAPEPAHTTKETALWAGFSAFFGSLVGIQVLEAITHKDWVQVLGAVLIALIAAGAVYSKERLTVARRGADHDPPSA